MEKTTYNLAEELISADEARIKTEAIQSGLLLNVQKINKVIKDRIAVGGNSIVVRDLPEAVQELLTERGYRVATKFNEVGMHVISWL